MSILTIVFLILGTALSILYFVLCGAAASKYRPLVEGLDDSKHLFKSVYSIGFFFLERFEFILKTKKSRERYRQCEIIHGDIYAEYYLRLNYAQKISVSLFFVPLSFLSYPIVKSVPLSMLVLVVAVVCSIWYYDMQITDVMEQRRDEIARDLPDVLSKLTLLVNAGMILREAWERVSLTGESTVYLEMRKAVLEMKNGASESQAIIAFGSRCMSSEVKKFASTLVQNLSKGNKELGDYLRKQSSIQWEEKKQYAKQKGEAASSKLMIPIAGMMVGVIIMVVVPMFSGMGI